MKLLQSLSQFLARNTSLFIIIVAILTFHCPGLFSWVRGSTQMIILGIIMLTMGMTLTLQDFKILAQRPWQILLGTIAQYTIMPLLAYMLTHLLNLPLPIATGLILVGCCPGGVSSNIMAFLAKGDVAYSVGMTTVSTLLSPLATPLLTMLCAGQTVEIDGFGMFKSILLVTLLPVLIGCLLNMILGKKKVYNDVCSIMPAIAVIGLACIVGGVISAQGSNFFSSTITIFIAVFLHNLLGYILGYTTGKVFRLSPPKQRTLSIEVGVQNAGLATGLASKHFSAMPEAAMASAVSCVWHSISGTLVAGFFAWLEQRKQSKQ